MTHSFQVVKSVVRLSLRASLLAALLMGCAAEDEDDPSLDNLDKHGGLAGDIRPVIWVHGCAPPGATNDQVSHFTDAQRDFFRARGYPDNFLVRFVYSGATCDGNQQFANQIASLVSSVRASTGEQHVDIVAHSMGAIATRLYLNQGGTSFVKHLAMLGGTNHGALAGVEGVALQTAFGAPAYEGMKELFPIYACQGQTLGAADIQFAVNGCLTLTGRTVNRDETPGSLKYLSIRNTLDGEVLPIEVSCVNQKKQLDCTDPVNKVVTVAPAPGNCGGLPLCPGHVTMLSDPGVMQQVFDFISHP
jgi:triacylglycerol esterase/lipase EstA (alpha/beta hydrolase family)